MGGLRRKIPFTYWVMVIGTLALTGFPAHRRLFLQGRDHRGGLSSAQSVGALRLRDDVIAAGLTAFYSWRLIFKTFHGEPHDQHHYEEAHEAPLMDAGDPARRPGAGSILAGFPF